MVRDPFGDDDAPALQDVLDALGDPDCRAIVSALDSPMTASELSDATDVPLSTTYRKLDRLTEASLLAERTEVRQDGQHTTRYEVDFEEVRIGLDGNRSFDVGVGRPERSPDEQLAAMWSEVQKET